MREIVESRLASLERQLDRGIKDDQSRFEVRVRILECKHLLELDDDAKGTW